MQYVVAAPTTTGRLSIMFTGTRSQCLTYIRHRQERFQPTHFCHVARDTSRALQRLANWLGVDY